MWDKAELKFLRSSMSEHIRTRPWWRRRKNKSVMFACDGCDEVADCEWAFHEETFHKCIQEAWEVAYTEKNYRTKKSLMTDLARGEVIRVYQPGPFGPNISDGDCYLEGPHYPEPHRWYAKCKVQKGRILPGSLK